MFKIILYWSRNRKLRLSLFVIVLSWLALVIPPIIFSKTILTDGSFVTLISIITSFYLGTNVYQKKSSLKQEEPSKEPNPEGE